MRRRVLGWMAVAVVILLAGCYGWLSMRPKPLRVDVSGPAGRAVDGARAAALPPPAAAAAQPTEPGDVTPDIKDYIPPGREPEMGEVIARLRAAGVQSGIAAFNPPGTRPPLVGIAVPEDFPLPEGYVRHTQTTDDGQRIEPILMFSPDYDFFDAQGRPIQVPENRVVPPVHAPPGLNVRMIRIPPPR
ncbi:hypothetical protein EBB59_08890 [Lysobacter pythonis]|uniref:Uncharacterized protein n=1 Tax=Solilutibacter pythonis TaxID=2483112 RepID=A0A3M2HMV8_9GAMM|nr:hypothetical protein [Lysobacter pythonis]RMH91046.1 hypothetical protein EBB59_08890 [Lysobacter pythonis]